MTSYVQQEPNTDRILQEDDSLIILEAFGIDVNVTSLGLLNATLSPATFVGSFINVFVTGMSLTASMGNETVRLGYRVNVTGLQADTEWGNEQVVAPAVINVTSMGEMTTGMGTAIFKRVWVAIPNSQPTDWTRIETPRQ